MPPLTPPPSANFAEKLAATHRLLRSAAAEHSHIKFASSLGLEDMVIGHVIETAQLPIAAFVLQTGQLHAETLALLGQIQATWRTPIEVYEPSHKQVVAFVRREGADMMYKSQELRKACCDLRKMEPLARALAGCTAWVTGLRREQSAARAEVHTQETEASGRVKYAPLADWTWGDVWHYVNTHAVPYNALHDQFYPSIGCQPCTRAVPLGADPRSGRWWWEETGAKECGLHVKKAA